MSDRIDRDVINALIAGHFADPFSVLGMKSVPFYPTLPMCG